MSDLSDLNIITGIYHINSNKTNIKCTTYNLKTELYKNTYNVYQNDNINIKIINAEKLQDKILAIVYYNSNFSLNNFISAFNWSENINEKSISSQNVILADNYISSYVNLNNKTYSIYAVGDNVLIPNSLLNVDFSTILPSKFSSTINISYPYISTNNLKLSNYGVFFDQNPEFGDYLNYAQFQSKSFTNKSGYDSVILCGFVNNNSYIILNKNNNINNLQSLNLKCNYTFNNRLQNQKIYSTTIKCNPVYAYLSTGIAGCITNNNYNTYINLLTNGKNLITINCQKNDLIFNLLKNNMYYIDLLGNIQESNQISANFYCIDVQIDCMSSCFSDKQNHIINEKTTLSCLHLNSYTANNTYTFELPSYNKNKNLVIINPSSYFISNTGFNNIFDFSINNKELVSCNLSSTQSIIANYPFIISTNILEQAFIPVSTNVSATYNFHKFNTIKHNRNIGTYYNTENYDLSSILSTYVTGLTNDTQISITANFNDKNYINILSADNSFDNSILNGIIKYSPVINTCYNSINIPISLSSCQAKLSLVGNYINRLNSQYYIYSDSETYNLSSQMFLQNSPSSIITSYISVNDIYIISGLKSKLDKNSIQYNIIQQSLLSSFMDEDGNLNLYNYNGLTTLLTRYSLIGLNYYQISSNLYIQLDDIFIGSKNINYNLIADNINTVLTMDNNMHSKFNTINNIPLSTSNYILTDNLTSTNINFNICKFVKDHYLTWRYSSNESQLINTTPIIYNNYSFNTSAFIYNSNNAHIIVQSNQPYGGSILTSEISANCYNNYTNFQLSSKNINVYNTILPIVSSFIVSGQSMTSTVYVYPIMKTDYYSSILLSKIQKEKTLSLSSIFTSDNIALNTNLYKTPQNLIDNISVNIISADYFTIQKDINQIYLKYFPNNLYNASVQVYFKLKDNNHFGILEVFFD